MKKSLIAIAVIAAGAAGYYVSQQQSAGAQINLAQLDYVPADSAFFYGQFSELNYKDYFALTGGMATNTELEAVIGELEAGDNPNLKFFSNVLRAYADSIASSDALEAKWGLGENYKSLMYTIGLTPVVRYQASKPEALVNTLLTAAKDAGLTTATEDKSGIQVNRITLEIDARTNIDLIVAKQDKWVTLTLNTELNTPADLDVAIGLVKPTNPISATNKLSDFVSKYQFDGKTISYIDHVEIVNAITGKTDSRLKQMIDKFLELTSSVDALAVVRNQACQTDLGNIAALWPATVSGSKKLEVTANYANIEVDTIIENSDSELMKSLSNIRGFAPKHTFEPADKVFSLAYGIDVAKIAPLVNTVYSRFTKAEFGCEPLVMAQQQAKQSNPAGIGMMTAMGGSLKGVSFSLQDFDFNLDENQQPVINSLDALFTISASDPVALVNMAKSFVPQLAQVELNDNGEPLQINDLLPMPIPFDKPINIAVKGSHIALYTGDKAQTYANDLTSQQLEQNVVSNVAFNSQAFFKPLAKVIEMSGEELPPEFEQLKNSDMSIYFSLDVKEKGILIETDVDVKKAKL